ncbi:MAG: ImmA/IrrE family metallo-endopeptidase [Bacteroidales bacterium]|nr:ImmA/IrrE family metallo-endopeptidase [Bacteroidales bacterium]
MEKQNLKKERGLPEFKLDFDSEKGEYWRSIKDTPEDDYSETVKGPDGGLWPSGRRWIQFLDEIEKLTFQYRNLFTNKLDIIRLAKNHGCSITSFSDPFAENLNLNPEQKKFIKEAAEKADKEGNEIDGFSFFDDNEKRIFYSNKIDKSRQRFTIAHELSHLLLGHNRVAFCKISNDKNPLETSKYHEEADKLAAFSLMPHRYMKKNMKKDNKRIARRLHVPVKAVEKRKTELDNEIYALCYK